MNEYRIIIKNAVGGIICTELVKAKNAGAAVIEVIRTVDIYEGDTITIEEE